MGALAFLLLSYLVIVGQNFFAKVEQIPLPQTQNRPIIQTVSQNESSVVMIRGFGRSPQGMGMNNSFGGLMRYSVQSTQGTGFVISRDGTILTNRHVVENSEQHYTVTTSSGIQYEVVDIRRDPNNDIAIVKIDPGQHDSYQLTAVELGDSSVLKPGQPVAALGDDPGNIQPTMLSGNIMGTGQTIIAGDQQSQNGVERLHNVIQTNLDLVPGNSGSPLFDAKGKVVGINTATSTDINSVSFAVPINAAKSFLGTLQ